jgi:DNA-binding transcriptional regulator LsrR (DeoR family)
MATNDDEGAATSRFPGDLMFRAANAYYLDDQKQGEIAEALGVSRPTVSRLLSEARRLGIVEIRVNPPADEDVSELEQACARSLGVKRVYVVPAASLGSSGAHLASGVKRALDDVGLQGGDSLLISSGRTLYEISQQALPQYPEILVAPTVGGLEEPEPWWQTNELTRLYAQRMAGHPVYLYAPAMPSPLLSESLKVEPSFQRISHMWDTAKAALLGVGAPPLLRSRRAAFFPSDQDALSASAGDICSRFFDAEGQPVSYAGSERLVAITPEQLHRIPASIGVAAGSDKVVSLRASARGRYINTLVTDAPTARLLVIPEH